MSRRQRQQSGPDPLHTIFDSLFRGIWWLVSYPFRDKRQASRLEAARQEFRGYWNSVEQLAQAGQWREAIMKADIVLDKALQFHSTPGVNVGERLKASTTRLEKSVLDAAWSAHKVRNRLAHELHYQLNAHEAKQALADFRKVLQAMGLL